MSKKPERISLSNSQVSKWQHSPRCFWWRYIRNLELADTADYLIWGGAVHTLLEHLYEGRSVTDAFELMRDEGDLDDLDRLEVEGNYHTEGALRVLADEYAEQLEEDVERFEIVDVERNKEYNLTNSVAWLGKLDLILRDREDGEIYIMDHKTTSKKVSSSYYVDRYSHDQQMTSYWWLGQEDFGDDFAGILINAFQTTKTIPYRHARFPVVRDNWQIEEWFNNMRIMGPTIAHRKKLGRELYESGLRETDAEVLNAFPICDTYSENFCDYRHLNWAAPSVRPAIIESRYAERQRRENT